MRSNDRTTILVSQMQTRKSFDWNQSGFITQKRTIHHKQRLLRYTMLAVVSVCLGTGGILAFQNSDKAQSVMSRMTAGFEYDETLGRLQFVNNLLPESAMVFMQDDSKQPSAIVPTQTQILHAWSQEEPWLEYSCVGDITACLDGQIMTVVQNRDNQYTVRIAHQNGYESIYSGLRAIQVKEYDTVCKGQQIGTAAGYTAFEWRKDGLSVLPVFSSVSEI